MAQPDFEDTLPVTPADDHSISPDTSVPQRRATPAQPRAAVAVEPGQCEHRAAAKLEPSRGMHTWCEKCRRILDAVSTDGGRHWLWQVETKAAAVEPGGLTVEGMAERLATRLGWKSPFSYRARDAVAFTLTGLPLGPERDVALAAILAHLRPDDRPKADVETLRQRVTELEAALEPLARAGRSYPCREKQNQMREGRAREAFLWSYSEGDTLIGITVLDARRAAEILRAALATTPDGEVG